MGQKKYLEERDLECFLKGVKKINLVAIPEEYGDFCIEINNFRAIIELKRVVQTVFEKKIDELNKPSVFTFDTLLITDAGDKLKLDKINIKGKRIEDSKDPKYYPATYIGLITVEKDSDELEERLEQRYSGFDIKIIRFFLSLTAEPYHWIPCLPPKNGNVIDFERKRYFIPKQYQNEKANQQLKYVDYFGILRKSLNPQTKKIDFEKWRFELIENPFIKEERKIPEELLASTLDFIDIFTPEWVSNNKSNSIFLSFLNYLKILLKIPLMFFKNLLEI
jgi:hypothetical protein